MNQTPTPSSIADVHALAVSYLTRPQRVGFAARLRKRSVKGLHTQLFFAATQKVVDDLPEDPHTLTQLAESLWTKYRHLIDHKIPTY